MELQFSGGRFVSLDGDLNYREVLNNFPAAKTIRIITYNISKSIQYDELLDALRVTDADVQIITNVPSRMNTYLVRKRDEIMAVFDVLPGNFFSVLVSTNREIYVEALLLLHQMFQFELNIKVDDYISALISLQEDKDFTPEEDDEVAEGSLTFSGKARLILGRFIKTGWVEKEFLDGSFIEIITPQPYAIPVMKLLGELGNGGGQEYNSLVFATYSALKQAELDHTDQMYEAVLSAKTNTEQLQYQLRSLYHGIRSYLRGIENQSGVNDLLQNHFESYKKMSDRIYHPIKTMDSIHRYMVPIQNLLMDVLGNAALMQTMCDRAMPISECYS